MDTQVTIAILSFVGTLLASIGTLVGVFVSNNKARAVQNAEFKNELANIHTELKTEVREVKMEVQSEFSLLQQNACNRIDAIHDSVVELKKETEKHNSVIERTFILEKDMALVKQNQDTFKEQLKIVETKVGKN